MAIERRLDSYSFSITGSGEKIDYPTVFSEISNIPVVEREAPFRDGTLVLFSIFQRPDYVFLRVALGSDDSLQILDRRTGEIRAESLSDNELLVQITHVGINLNSRRALVEYVHRGVKADGIEYFIQYLLSEKIGVTDVDVTLNPVPIEALADEIESLTRIDEAILRITRPNPGWADHYMEGLEKLAEDSGAGTFEVHGRRTRKAEGLSKDTGIIPLISELIRGGVSSFRNAVVSGLSAVGAQTVISTARRVRNERARFNEVSPGYVHPTEIDEYMHGHLADSGGSDQPEQ